MKKQKTSFMQKFERLYKEAVDEDNLFGAEGDDIIDDYESDIDELGDSEEGGAEEVTITLSTDQVEVLRDILSQVEGDEEGEEEGEEGEEDFDAFGDEDVTDIEELEEEAVETQSAPDAESVRSKTKSGKASTKTGDLDCDSQCKDGEEKQYKFVKREKPTELKYKTTKGS
jgi:hypothetical protein